MRIQVINPNTSRRMTADIASAAKRVRGVAEIVCVQPSEGPSAIESDEDIDAVSPYVIDLVAGAAEACDAHVIACFGDPAIVESRRVASGPVLGIAQGSMIVASVIGERIGVMVPMEGAVEHTLRLAAQYGFSRQLNSVRSLDTGVAGLHSMEGVESRVLETALQLVEDGADVLILGCGGMADIADWLADQVEVPVIEGVRATVGLVMGLAAAGLEVTGQGATGKAT